MKKNVFTICLISLFIVATGCNQAVKKAVTAFKADYQKITDEYDQATAKEDLKREDYMALRKDKNAKLEALLTQYETVKSDELDLLRVRVLSDLRKNDEAMKIADAYISKDSEFKNQILLEKVDLLLGERKNKEAFDLFKTIEDKVPVDEHLYGAYLSFTFYAPTPEEQKAYGNKLLAVENLPEEIQKYMHYVYSELAEIEKTAGHFDEAIKIINTGVDAFDDEGQKIHLMNALSGIYLAQGDTEKALSNLEKIIETAQDKGAKADAEAQLKKIKLVGQSAPALVAETWMNTGKLSLDQLKGKLVIVDFWAPWCGPCRAVIPTLVQAYGKYKDQGLEIVGFTRIYGRYSDDQENKGKVEKDEELQLIGEFLKRFKIEYPIAVAEADAVFNEYGIRGIPTLFFIDKKGNVAEFEVGSGSPEALLKKIEELLK